MLGYWAAVFMVETVRNGQIWEIFGRQTLLDVMMKSVCILRTGVVVKGDA